MKVQLDYTTREMVLRAIDREKVLLKEARDLMSPPITHEQLGKLKELEASFKNSIAEYESWLKNGVPMGTIISLEKA